MDLTCEPPRGCTGTPTINGLNTLDTYVRSTDCPHSISTCGYQRVRIEHAAGHAPVRGPSESDWGCAVPRRPNFPIRSRYFPSRVRLALIARRGFATILIYLERPESVAVRFPLRRRRRTRTVTAMANALRRRKIGSPAKGQKTPKSIVSTVTVSVSDVKLPAKSVHST